MTAVALVCSRCGVRIAGPPVGLCSCGTWLGSTDAPPSWTTTAADRTSLPDRILTADDGTQTEYWYGPGRRTVVSLTRLAPDRWRLDVRTGDDVATLHLPDARVYLARRFAAEWCA